MPLTPSQRSTREWPLLVMTIALVGIVCFPLWQNVGGSDAASWSSWTRERWGQLLLGPEQFACYVAFLWAFFIFASRFLETRRQRHAFAMGLLPVEEGARILLEDARPLQRKIDQITAAKGPFILANMIRQALAKFVISRSSQDVNNTVKTQAEVDHGRLVSTMANINYLAWAIPAIGFFGTVRGLAGSMTVAGQGGEQLRIATRHLTVAFDCTLVALALSLVVMYLIHVISREEEALVIDCQQYCLEHLVNRLYEPEPLSDAPALPVPARDGTPPGAIAGTLSERLAQ
ncbi:MAG: MotA/TolQ/ExbB proton channel family protein [Gemmataceae bacterium]|nr:MotA/TolQ/ExbB proton channel family protein [Gemmataceae bacterium]